MEFKKLMPILLFSGLLTGISATVDAVIDDDADIFMAEQSLKSAQKELALSKQVTTNVEEKLTQEAKKEEIPFTRNSRIRTGVIATLTGDNPLQQAQRTFSLNALNTTLSTKQGADLVFGSNTLHQAVGKIKAQLRSNDYQAFIPGLLEINEELLALRLSEVKSANVERQTKLNQDISALQAKIAELKKSAEEAKKKREEQEQQRLVAIVAKEKAEEEAREKAEEVAKAREARRIRLSQVPVYVNVPAINYSVVPEQQPVQSQVPEQPRENVVVPTGNYSPAIVALRSAGVMHHEGKRITYYNLPMGGVQRIANSLGLQISVDNNGVWRDNKGRIVVAYGMSGYGQEVNLPWGTGIILDHCPAGACDVAVTW